MASARLRKTFKYPNDSESDEDPDELDEQGDCPTIPSGNPDQRLTPVGHDQSRMS